MKKEKDLVINLKNNDNGCVYCIERDEYNGKFKHVKESENKEWCENPYIDEKTFKSLMKIKQQENIEKLEKLLIKHRDSMCAYISRLGDKDNE